MIAVNATERDPPGPELLYWIRDQSENRMDPAENMIPMRAHKP